MYGHSAQMNVPRPFLPSPAPEDLTDSESEIMAELDRRRRELDEEIAEFRKQKEREFHIFEKELRSKRKNERSDSRDAPGVRGPFTHARSM